MRLWWNLFGPTNAMVTYDLRAYGAALREIGAGALLRIGRRLTNPVENSQRPFRGRERATERFGRMKILQKFCSVHAQVHNHSSQERHLISRQSSENDARPPWLSGGRSWPEGLLGLASLCTFGDELPLD